MPLSWERLQCLLALENTGRWSWEKKTSNRFLLSWESAVCSKTSEYFRDFMIMDCSYHFSMIDDGSSKCITLLL